MAIIRAQDRFFSGQVDASTPPRLLGEGVVRRILNGKFVEGAITNAHAFDELTFDFVPNRFEKGYPKTNIFASSVEYSELLRSGDVQLVTSYTSSSGAFLILVISGLLFRYNLLDQTVEDITPKDAYLPTSSFERPLSFLDNNNGTYNIGGNMVIFNHPNRTILISDTEVRLANEALYEVPPARLGILAGGRMFIIRGDNSLWASDPFGGANPLAPLTFQETQDPLSSFYLQTWKVGNGLDIQKVTALAALPKYLSANQDFLNQNVLISSYTNKYLIPAAAPRDTWSNSQFITYAGSLEGIAGPHAWTNVGDNIFYTSVSGRIKALGQDQQRQTSLGESYYDSTLGQFLSDTEMHFHFREWYKALNHSRSILKYYVDTLYASIYPMNVPALYQFGDTGMSPTHAALACARLDDSVQLSANANLTWDSIYDWIHPIGITVVNDKVYVVSKDCYGRIRIFVENRTATDTHDTTIFTRGYFSPDEDASMSKSIVSGNLYFRVLNGPIQCTIYYGVDGEWVKGVQCVVKKKQHSFNMLLSKCRTNDSAIPLKVVLSHNGCPFELEAIYVEGELYLEEK